MDNTNSIIIKNIYYMLTYAFKILRQSNFDEIEAESFEHIYDMFASILSKGISKQIKQGLYKEYKIIQNNLPMMKGKLNIEGTIKNKIQKNHNLVCEYDDLSENNIYNQIIKLTIVLLLKQSGLTKKFRDLLKKNLLYFGQVDNIDYKSINWTILQFQRNNANYKMLLNICWFVIEGLLLTTEKGKFKMSSFLDDQKMHSLFENFVLEYYKQHHKCLQPSAPKIDWIIDESTVGIRFLPEMKTDIVLHSEGRKLIIDTKYYQSSTQTSFYGKKETIHSNNLYQIFTYVKNEDKLNSGNVSGMLLYAKTVDNIAVDQNYLFGKNNIFVKNLDLNVTFNEIKKQLDYIAEMIW